MAKKPSGPKYVWADAPKTFKGARDADPNEIGRSLDQIASDHGGRLEPGDIVEAARARSHVLHQHFEWNVNKAAEYHWMDTARRLARSVMLVSDAGSNEPPKRAWISVEDDGISYRRIDEVM